MVEYSFKIGLGKSVKNVLVTVGVPALMVLINSYLDWMPESWYPIAVPLMSVISYQIKNYLKVKKE